MLARAICVSALLFVGAVHAADPASGTLTTETTTLTFATGPHTSTSLGNCEQTPCDEFALTAQLPANFRAENPAARITIDLAYTVPGDLDMVIESSDGTELDNSGQPPGLPEHMDVPALGGTNSYVVRVVPFAGANMTATVTIALVVPPPAPPDPPLVPPSGLAPRYQVLVAPPTLGNDAAEPSVGYNKFTDRAMFISYTQALRITFPENLQPARPASCPALWEDKSGTLTTLNTLDPILFTDEATGRTFNSQLSGANSLFEFTDDDGENWTPGQIGVPNGGADHQTVASGPFPAGLAPPTAMWPSAAAPRAVYYCSQSVAGAMCARSDDGGQTFGPGFAFKNTDCSAGALHGHVKVAPDGTVYVPDSSQCLLPLGETAEKVVAFVSEDAGATFEARPLPASLGGAPSDPSIGIATDGTAYMCYENGDGRVRVAVSHDKGATWVNDQDIGRADGVKYSRFPQMVAGDPDRAACAFLGATGGPDDYEGDPDSLTFARSWYPYIATTYDGGVSWHLVNASPNDPVQGHGGVGPSGTNRNLLDFNDLQIDEYGRTLFALADGCTRGCVIDPAKNHFAAKAMLIRQVGGRSLFAAHDDAAGTRYNATAPLAPAPACPSSDRSVRTIAQTKVVWEAPDSGGSAITNYNVLRSTSPAGGFTLIGSAGTNTELVDPTADPTVPAYYYRVVAENAQGASALSNTLELTLDPDPETVDTCTTPGDVIAPDTVGDAPSSDMDIVYVSVAEPKSNPEAFVVTMKIAGFTGGQPAESSFYPILFAIPDRFYVALDATEGLPQIVYGTFEELPQGLLAFTAEGTLDGSSYDADGTIRFVIPRNKLGDPPPGGVVAGFDARARLGASSATSRDTAGPSDYVVRGTGVCDAPAPLLATLGVSKTVGVAPMTVTFTVSADAPPGRTAQSYTLFFGDGERVENVAFNGQGSATVTHTYEDPGTFRAIARVTDNTGTTSENLAERTIEVTLQDLVFGNGFE